MRCAPARNDLSSSTRDNAFLTFAALASELGTASPAEIAATSNADQPPAEEDHRRPLSDLGKELGMLLTPQGLSVERILADDRST